MTRHRGILVAGSFDNGACRLQGDLWTPLVDQRSEYVHGVASDGNYLWVATSNGLMRYDAHFNTHPISEEDPTVLTWFANSAVTAATEAGEGRVLLGSPWGAVMIHRKSDDVDVRFIGKKKGVPSHLTKIAHRDGAIFFGSETRGVKSISPGRKRPRLWRDPIHLPEAWVLDVAPVTADTFWAATCQHGIARVSGEDKVFISADNGLADNRTIAVTPYRGGAFVTTLGGLSYAEPKGSARAATSRHLADPRGASLFLEGDTLWHGTESGLVRFLIDR
jgi:ligand-binding sensor domain-containing protein